MVWRPTPAAAALLALFIFLSCVRLNSTAATSREPAEPATSGDGVHVAVLDGAPSPYFHFLSDAPPVHCVPAPCSRHDGRGHSARHGTKTLTILGGNVSGNGKRLQRINNGSTADAFRLAHPSPRDAAAAAGLRFLGIAPRAKLTLFPLFATDRPHGVSTATTAATMTAVASASDVLAALQAVRNTTTTTTTSSFHLLCFPLGVPSPSSFRYDSTTTTTGEEEGRHDETLVWEQLAVATCTLAARGVVVVAAAGNSGPDLDTLSPYPSLGQLPCVVTVGASEVGGSSSIAPSSSRGPPLFFTGANLSPSRREHMHMIPSMRRGNVSSNSGSDGWRGPHFFFFAPAKPDVLDSFTGSRGGAAPVAIEGVEVSSFQVPTTSTDSHVHRLGQSAEGTGDLMVKPQVTRAAHGTSRAAAVITGILAHCVEAIHQEVAAAPSFRGREPEAHQAAAQARVRARFSNVAFLKYVLRQAAAKAGERQRQRRRKRGQRECPSRAAEYELFLAHSRERVWEAGVPLVLAFLHLLDGVYGDAVGLAGGAGHVDVATAVAVTRHEVRRALSNDTAPPPFLAYSIPEAVDVRVRRPANLRESGGDEDEGEGSANGSRCRWWWPQCEQPLRPNAPPRVFSFTVHTTACPTASVDMCGSGGSIRKEAPRTSSASLVVDISKVVGYTAQENAREDLQPNATSPSLLDVTLAPCGGGSDVAGFTGNLAILVRLSREFGNHRGDEALAARYDRVDLHGTICVPYRCRGSCHSPTPETACRIGEAPTPDIDCKDGGGDDNGGGPFELHIPFAFTLDLTHAGSSDSSAGHQVPARRLLLDSSDISLRQESEPNGFTLAYLYLTRVLDFDVHVFPLRKWFQLVSPAEATSFVASVRTVIVTYAPLPPNTSSAILRNESTREEEEEREWRDAFSHMLHRARDTQGTHLLVLQEEAQTKGAREGSQAGETGPWVPNRRSFAPYGRHDTSPILIPSAPREPEPASDNGAMSSATQLRVVGFLRKSKGGPGTAAILEQYGDGLPSQPRTGAVIAAAAGRLVESCAVNVTGGGMRWRRQERRGGGAAHGTGGSWQETLAVFSGFTADGRNSSAPAGRLAVLSPALFECLLSPFGSSSTLHRLFHNGGLPSAHEYATMPLAALESLLAPLLTQRSCLELLKESLSTLLQSPPSKEEGNGGSGGGTAAAAMEWWRTHFSCTAHLDNDTTTSTVAEGKESWQASEGDDATDHQFLLDLRRHYHLRPAAKRHSTAKEAVDHNGWRKMMMMMTTTHGSVALALIAITLAILLVRAPPR